MAEKKFGPSDFQAEIERLRAEGKLPALDERLEVVNVDGNVGFLTDPNRFLNGIEELGAFVAHVGEVDPIVLGGNFG